MAKVVEIEGTKSIGLVLSFEEAVSLYAILNFSGANDDAKDKMGEAKFSYVEITANHLHVLLKEIEGMKEAAHPIMYGSRDEPCSDVFKSNECQPTGVNHA